MKRVVTIVLTAAAVVALGMGCDKGSEPSQKKGGEATPKKVEGEGAKKAEAKPAGDKAPEAAKEAPKTEKKPVATTRGAGEAEAVKVAEPAKPKYDAKETPGEGNAALLEPGKLTEEAPATFKARFESTAGDWTVECTRDWAPKGVDRFYNLVKSGYFEDIAMFRAIKGFMVQFGIHGNPKISAAWREAKIEDDPVKQSNERGILTFAMAGPNTRTTQLFINFGNNSRLDRMGFPGICKVVEGMDNVDKIHTGYGEGAPRGRGPAQGRVQMQGNKYLKADFPLLDYIKKVSLVE